MLQSLDPKKWASFEECPTNSPELLLLVSFIGSVIVGCLLINSYLCGFFFALVAACILLVLCVTCGRFFSLGGERLHGTDVFLRRLLPII